MLSLALMLGILTPQVTMTYAVNSHVLLYQEREEAARRWAPVVWLHPEEHHFPSSVHHFLQHVKPSIAGSTEPWSNVTGDSTTSVPMLPRGRPSQESYLLALHNFECSSCPLPSFLFGKKPSRHHSPPVYATIHSCSLSFIRRESRSTDYLDNGYSGLLDDEATKKSSSSDTESQDEYILAQTSTSQSETSGVTLSATNLTPQPPPLPLFSNQKKMRADDSFKNFSVTREQTQAPVFSYLLHSLNSSFPVKQNTDTLFNDTNILEQALYNNESSKWDEIYASSPNFSSVIDKDSPNFNTSQETLSSELTSSSYIQQGTTNKHNKISNTSSNDGAAITFQPFQKHVVSNNVVVLMDNVTLHTKQDIQNNNLTQKLNVEQNQMIPNVTTMYHTSEKRHISKATTSDVTLLYKQEFTVTYWMFYPFNYGKDVCTANLGYFFGRVLKPTVNGVCYGEEVTMGNHVGDWEHISIQFKGSTPTQMYVSTHTFGAYYAYDPQRQEFLYAGQDTREGVPMFPTYPQTVKLAGFHPILYAARGSHGLWGAPGIHQYMPLPLLKDETGTGTAWKTWLNLDIIDLKDSTATQTHRHWWSYEGQWGNPGIRCHMLMAGFCEFVKGPTGISRKRVNFPCQKANSRTPNL